MASRDFSFLSLRPPLVAYQANGLPVPPNTVLITSSNGATTFSNTVSISTINASTSNSNYISSGVISAGLIDVSVLSTNTHFTSSISTTSITTGFLQATQALISGPTATYNWSTASLVVNNTISLIGETPASTQIYLHNGSSRLATNNPYGGLYLQASTPQNIWFSNLYASTTYGFVGPNQSQFNGNVNVTSTLNSNNISTSDIRTNSLSTFSIINLMNPGTSPLELTWNATQLLIDGHAVATEGTVSTVSTVFWDANTSGDGNIVNKNAGSGTTKYLVGIGYNKTSTINATLDVLYTGTTPGNVLNISTTNNNRLTMNNDGVVNITSSLVVSDYISTNIINMNNGQIAELSSINSNTSISLMPSSSTKVSITTSKNNGYTTLEIANTSNISSATKLNMKAGDIAYSIYTTNTNDGVDGTIASTFQIYSYYDNGANNKNVLTIYPNGDTNINGNITTTSSIICNNSLTVGSTINLNGAAPDGYGALKIGGAATENSIFIKDGTNVNPGNANNGYFIGNSIDFGGASTFQIGRIDNGLDQTNKAIYLTQSGNIGIGTSNPQFNLDIVGSIYASNFISTNSLSVTGNSASGSSSNQQTSVTLYNTNPVSGAPYDVTTNLIMSTSRGYYQWWLTNNMASGGSGGLTQDHLQLFSYFPSPSSIIDIAATGDISFSKNINIIGNLNVSGYAVSKVSTSGGIANLSIGNYNFINGNTSPNIILPGGSDGDIIVIRNTGATSTITVTILQDSTGSSILPGKTSSYIYTNKANTTGWYGL
jgi:hypothetical protein